MAKFQTHPPEQLIRTVIEELTTHLPNQEVLVLVSGGSQLDFWSQNFPQIAALPGVRNLHIGLVDERYYTDAQNPYINGAQFITKVGAEKLTKAGIAFHPVLKPNTSAADLASYYTQLISAAHKQGTYIMAVLGMGADMHTAGILPHKPELTTTFYDQAYVSYETATVAINPGPYTQRITLSFGGLELVDRVLLYAVGEDKCQPLTQLMATAESPPSQAQIAAAPVMFLHKLDKQIDVFTDCD